jgi:CheY-specific phosphatase CheX
MTSNLVPIFVQAFNDLVSFLGIDHKFLCELPESSMNSGEPVNVLVSVTGDLEGNIIFGYTPKTAKEIAAKLIGVEQLDEMDIYAQAALADFSSDVGKRVLHLIKQESMLYSTSGRVDEEAKECNLLASFPIYVVGEEMYALISKVPSKKLFFKINGEKFNLAYNLE